MLKPLKSDLLTNNFCMNDFCMNDQKNVWVTDQNENMFDDDFIRRKIDRS